MIHDCNECGYCKEACPMYRAILKETESPRGFIKLENKEQKTTKFFNCANCKACKEVCPSNVDFDIEKIRQRVIYEIETESSRRVLENVKRYGNPYGVAETEEETNKQSTDSTKDL